VKAALCAGLYPNILRVDRERSQLTSLYVFPVVLNVFGIFFTLKAYVALLYFFLANTLMVLSAVEFFFQFLYRKWFIFCQAGLLQWCMHS